MVRGRRSRAKLLLSFLSFPWGGDRAAGAHASAAVEQLLVCRFENLGQSRRRETLQQEFHNHDNSQ